jgi:heat shock protein HtpX
MSIAAGISTPKCYILQDPSLNAYAVSGRRGAVVVTSGLLAAVDRRQLQGVVAHEIAHIRNRDSNLIYVTILGLGLFVTLIAMGGFVSRHSRTDPNDGQIPILQLIVVVTFILAIVALPAMLLLHFAMSRKREELADAAAVQYTRDPTGLRQALEKMAGSYVPLHRIGFATKALCCDDPARIIILIGAGYRRGNIPGSPRGLLNWLISLRPRGFLQRFFDTHPPIERRINWLWAQESAPPAPR